jgi:pyruvyl transferase EpsO
MSTEKIAQLRGLIGQRLRPLLTGDLVLVDCPYHANVGDSLIWEGELAFFRESGLRLLGYGSVHTWLFPRLDPRTVVLLHGGGSFGDLWRQAQEFRLKVFETYPDNPIVILPQSVHYDDEATMRADARAMARHRRLTICARDTASEKILRENFDNEVVLVPDMAFCVPPESLVPREVRRAEGALLIRRADREVSHRPLPAEVPAGATVRDWPTLEHTEFTTWLMYKMSGLCDRLAWSGGGGLRRGVARMVDRLALGTVHPRNLRAGIDLLAPYDVVYSTRLHGAILSMLMGRRETFMIDNSYGKLSAFHETWLRDAKGVRLL